MKPNELRIGNIIFDPKRKDVDLDKLGNGIYRVSSWAIERHDSGYLELKPIPLTEEWMEKFGFQVRKANGFGGQDMWSGMGVISNGKVNFRGTAKHLHLEGYFNTQVKYVHTLQNLYYALTGTELEIKD